MENTKIDWCDSSWNPVSGCLHGCKYCYARGIAERFRNRKGYELNEEHVRFNFHFDGSPTTYELSEPCYYEKINEKTMPTGERIKAPYPYGFAPTFHRYRLDDYINKSGRNIFVCSMSDLFGSWVSDEWIKEVFDACRRAPQHNYLFLTKNPARYNELINNTDFFTESGSNMWFGYSYTGKECKQWWNPDYNIYASVEPILELVDMPRCKWLIVGAETGNRKGRVVPERAWIKRLVEQCQECGVPVFMKSSLSEIWGKSLIREFPEGLRKEEAV